MSFVTLLSSYYDNLDEQLALVAKEHRLRIGMNLGLLLPETETVVSIIEGSIATDENEIMSSGFVCYKHKDKIIIHDYSYTGHPKCIDVPLCAYNKTIKSNIKHKISKNTISKIKSKYQELLYVLSNDVKVFDLDNFKYEKYIYSYFDSKLIYIVPYLKAFSKNFDEDLKKVVEHYSRVDS